MTAAASQGAGRFVVPAGATNRTDTGGSWCRIARKSMLQYILLVLERVRDTRFTVGRQLRRCPRDARAITRGLDNSACHEGPAPGRLIWQKVTKVAKVVILALARA